MKRNSSGGWGTVLAALIVIGVVVVAVMWTLSLFGHAVGLTPTYHDIMNRDKRWLHENYPNVGWRYILTALLLALTGLGVQRAFSWLSRDPSARAALTARRVGAGMAIGFVALLCIRASIGSPSATTESASASSTNAPLAVPVASSDDQETADAAALARERRAERRREATRRAARRRGARARARRRAQARARAAAEATPTARPAPTPTRDCDPNYSGCLDPNSPDYDCEGGSGDGPDYTGTVRVLGDDHYDLERDGDGIACDAS